jgi:hypothetical protein
MMRSLCVPFAVLTIVGRAESRSAEPDSYDVILHSHSRAEQRAALNTILRRRQDYVPRIRQSLREYPRMVRTDWLAATRAVHLAALVRDSSFAPILVGMLRDSTVLEECIYACPVVFALTMQAAFGGWSLPTTLDTSLTTVTDLQHAVRYASRTILDVLPIDSVIQGAVVERNRKRIAGKSEEELIKMVGNASYGELAMLAPFALQVSVTTSKNRNDLYLLLMDDDRADASNERRGAIYLAIYRAETARARGR